LEEVYLQQQGWPILGIDRLNSKQLSCSSRTFLVEIEREKIAGQKWLGEIIDNPVNIVIFRFIA